MSPPLPLSLSQTASVGEWWMDVTLEYGGTTATTRFTIPVKTAN